MDGEIKDEIYTALEGLGAPPLLLATVGSWGDTLSDEETLQLLKDWNAKAAAKGDKRLA